MSEASVTADTPAAPHKAHRGRLFRKYLLLIMSLVSVGLLVSGGIIGSAIAASALEGSGSRMEEYAQWGFFASLILGAVLVVIYTVRLFRGGGD